MLAFVTSAAGMTWLAGCAVKAALLLGASWVGARILRRSTAAARHQMWMLGVVGALALPLLCWVVPSLWPSALTTVTVGSTSLVSPGIDVIAHASTTPTWPMWTALAWALGTLVGMLRLVRGHLAARRLLRGTQPAVPASWTAALRGIDAPARVRLLCSATIGSPMTMGVIRPRVLLPAVAEAWTPERLRAVLLHEVGHVRRRDTLVQLAAEIACALYWWNPLAWVAAARLRSEREHACDDLVLAAGVLPSSYATDLLDVARSMAVDARAAVICMVDRSWTETRLRRILDDNAPRGALGRSFTLGAGGLAMGGALLLACTASAPERPDAAVTTRGQISVGAGSPRNDWDMLHPPVREGTIDLALVTEEVKRRRWHLEECYQRRLAVKPDLAGTIVMHWNIAESGKVNEQCITTDTVNDDGISSCVNELVKEGDFPAPTGGAVDVSFPFVFSPR